MEEEYEEEFDEIPKKLSGKALIEKQSLIKKEKNRISKLFKELEGSSKKIVTKLIENAAFMSVQLDELKDYITTHGVKETYMNGQNQFGYKESIESKTYNTMIKNYMNIIKQLNDMMPEPKKIDEDDEFNKFNDMA